jgi:hypothetical protein
MWLVRYGFGWSFSSLPKVAGSSEVDALLGIFLFLSFIACVSSVVWFAAGGAFMLASVSARSLTVRPIVVSADFPLCSGAPAKGLLAGLTGWPILSRLDWQVTVRSEVAVLATIATFLFSQSDLTIFADNVDDIGAPRSVNTFRVGVFVLMGPDIRVAGL